MEIAIVGLNSIKWFVTAAAVIQAQLLLPSTNSNASRIASALRELSMAADANSQCHGHRAFAALTFKRSRQLAGESSSVPSDATLSSDLSRIDGMQQNELQVHPTPIRTPWESDASTSAHPLSSRSHAGDVASAQAIASMDDIAAKIEALREDIARREDGDNNDDGDAVDEDCGDDFGLGLL